MNEHSLQIERESKINSMIIGSFLLTVFIGWLDWDCFFAKSIIDTPTITINQFIQNYPAYAALEIIILSISAAAAITAFVAIGRNIFGIAESGGNY